MATNQSGVCRAGGQRPFAWMPLGLNVPGYLILFALTFLGTANVVAQQYQPVPGVAVPKADLFPGAINPDIRPENIDETICHKGWSTKSIRPPTSYTTALKKAQLRSLGYAVPNSLPRIPTKNGKNTKPDLSQCVEYSANLSCYEEDHLISLELGGDPRSPDNLWPEPWFGPWNAHVKDVLENTLHRMVCHGDISLRDAQTAMAADWVAAYRKYVTEPAVKRLRPKPPSGRATRPR